MTLDDIMADDSETRLPPELILHVLHCLEPDDPASVPTLVACQSVSRSFASLALHSSVWVRHCRWKRGSSLEQDAYDYFKRRRQLDQETRASIMTMASRGYGRLPLIQQIREQGEDVLEVLQDEKYDPELWMTERYWASETTKGVFRDLAIKTWKR